MKRRMKASITFLSLLTGVAIFTGCEKDEKTEPDPPKPAPVAEATVLDCNYFIDNPNAVLMDNPDAPVDYIIPCEIRVEKNLIIEPGVVIAFEQNAGMRFDVDAQFSIEGTADKPIVFTGTEHSVGFWKGIATWSTNSSNIMKYVTIEYAGSNSIQYGENAALAVFTAQSRITIDNCTFSNNAKYGLSVFVANHMGKDEESVKLTNSTFTNNDIPVKTNTSHIRMFNATNSFTGNTNDYIFLDGGNIFGDATWPKLDVPYLMKNVGSSHGLEVKDGVLTIEPGVEIIMTARSRMEIAYDASLIMVGTPSEPIIIRGEYDVAGYWDQLEIGSASPLNEIGYVKFKNAGVTTGYPNGAVWLIYSKFLSIHDVTFVNCFEYGMSLDYAPAMDPFYLEYSNLSLDNTEHLFSDWNGALVTNP